MLFEVLERVGWLGDTTPLRVALAEMVAAFSYDHGCRSCPVLAEPGRYLHHAVVTNGMNVYLAVDLIAGGAALDHAQIALAHNVIGELSYAMRYAHDVTSVERERGEGSQNIIELWRRCEDGADDDALRRRAAARVGSHLARARSLDGTRTVPGLTAVVDAAAGYLARFSFTTTVVESATSPDSGSLALHLSGAEAPSE